MNNKHSLLYTLLILISSCTPKNGLMTTREKDGSKMLLGTSAKSDLMNDKAFSWFREGYSTYQPDARAVSTIRSQAQTLHIEVFGGTWCSDTHDLLPGFYKGMDAAGLTDSQITLHLVNREKKTPDGSAEKYHITNVPTFIIFKGDKQLGKIVESPKTTVEGDIAAILTDKQ
jgi:hypothetical protein